VQSYISYLSLERFFITRTDNAFIQRTVHDTCTQFYVLKIRKQMGFADRRIYRWRHTSCRAHFINTPWKLNKRVCTSLIDGLEGQHDQAYSNRNQSAQSMQLDQLFQEGTERVKRKKKGNSNLRGQQLLHNY